MTDLPKVLSLNFSKPQYERGALDLSAINQVTTDVNRPPRGTMAERIIMRLECLAIGLRALDAESVANELDDIASEVRKLPIPVSLPKPVPGGIRR